MRKQYNHSCCYHAVYPHLACRVHAGARRSPTEDVADETSSVPTAETILLAKQQRKVARERGDEFIPLEGAQRLFFY